MRAANKREVTYIKAYTRAVTQQRTGIVLLNLNAPSTRHDCLFRVLKKKKKKKNLAMQAAL